MMIFKGKFGKRTGSYAALLTMLVIWLFVFPLFRSATVSNSVLGEIVFAALLLVSVGATAGHPREMRLLAVLALALLASSILLHSDWMAALGVRVGIEALRIVFLLLITYVVMRHVIRAKTVSLDTLLGAVCVYLMAAGVFAEAYRLVDMLDPGGIRFLDDALEAGAPLGESGGRFVYFSVMTLTTVGFGDVVPVSPAARALVEIEAIIGQLYVAMILAWLVGKFMVEHEAVKKAEL